MTVPQLSESARLAQLEQRVQALEDVNAIRHLKARYAAYCDDQYNPDGLAALFTEDVVGKARAWGGLKGETRSGRSSVVPRSSSPLRSTTASMGRLTCRATQPGRSGTLFMPCTLGESNRAMWRAGVDHEEYVRVAGEWKFKRKTSAPLFHTPFGRGGPRRGSSEGRGALPDSLVGPPGRKTISACGAARTAPRGRG